MKLKLPKKYLNWKVLPLLVVATAAMGSLFIFSTNQPPKAEAPMPLPMSGLVPRNPNFCGEAVPMTDPEVVERFERDFILNAYDYATMTMIIKRLNRWKAIMTQILREEGVPEDFLYLMVAESAVRNATSIAGAQGYWQFMPQTGRDHGLYQDTYIDERNHPIKSTRAACAYLKRSYAQFHSWTLAAASYNMGSGGVDYNQKSQGVTNYYDIYMNEETSRYVFRILAFKYILQEPEKYGYHIPMNERYEPLAYRTVTVTRSIDDLVAFAKKEGTNFKTLVWMNPWIKRYQLPVLPGKSYELWLPVQRPRVAPYTPPADADTTPPRTE